MYDDTGRFLPIMNFQLQMSHPVREDIYQYFVNESRYEMKTIHVVVVVIEAVDEQGKEILFATQRGYGDMKGSWEFPGGKIEPGETPQEALKREIQEELDTKIKVGSLIDTLKQSKLITPEKEV